MRKLLFLYVLGIPLFAQFTPDRVAFVTSNPAGACTAVNITVNTSAGSGDLFACINMLWTKINTGSGTGITSLNGLLGATQTFANDTNVTITSVGTTHTLGWTGTLAKARIIGTAMYNDQANTISTGAQNYNAATSFLIPSGAGLAQTASSSLGYDSTANVYKFGHNGTSKIMAAFTGALADNDCLKYQSATNSIATLGAGCMTSVGASFTGGLISVGGTPVTSAGTLAFTVAGTSGGIPYFSGATTWASSAALTANLPVIGGGAGVAPSVGTVSGNTTQFVTTTGTQTSTAAVKIDASGNHIASGVTIDASNNVSTAGSVSSGAGSGNGGYVQLNGATSGSTGWTTPNVSGAQSFFVLPNPNGGSFTNAFLQITGTTTCPTGVPGANCYATAIATPPGAGTVASSTTGQVPVYTAATTVTGNANLTFSGSTLTLGVVGAATGGLVVAGGTSGSTTEAYPASGGGTWTHQTGTDTYVGRATTDTLTNKTINCASNTCTIPATNRTRAISISLGYPTNSSALGTSDVQYVTVPFACTISAYNFAIDAADATFRVKWWKVATGTAIPTSANSINTSGVGVPSGTAVHSTSLTDFSAPGLTVSANDIIAMAVATANTVKYINGVLECDQ